MPALLAATPRGLGIMEVLASFDAAPAGTFPIAAQMGCRHLRAEHEQLWRLGPAMRGACSTSSATA
ncbi:hypothetical protein GWK16_01330 [Roseomonas sp. JC162]|uniref:Uncharacterized protein n=1 Tax=Neoroseomonas marina TaxID=1232220 RepID=A0A848E9F8_9PROT|nr:hypothetical protein [Neoroseomonas marina]NMJ39865.1 hypothetical protein [Neoroseomonas marina]